MKSGGPRARSHYCNKHEDIKHKKQFNVRLPLHDYAQKIYVMRLDSLGDHRINCLLRPDQCFACLVEHIFRLFFLQLSCQPCFSFIHLQPPHFFQFCLVFLHFFVYVADRSKQRDFSFSSPVHKNVFSSVGFPVKQE
jgi:hypothetical protein